MADRVRLMVAGAGAFGSEHLRTLATMKGVDIAGIADVNAAAAESACRRHGAARWGTDAIALFEALRPDGLIVATPGSSHFALATHALALHIAVLVEKPVAVTAAQSRGIAEAEARSGAFVLPGHILRFSEPYRQFVELAGSKAVGTILSVTARRHRDEDHASRYSDDPVLMTMIHDIDLALWITGAGVTDVCALRQPADTPRSETIMLARGSNGAAWQLSAAWTFPAQSSPPDRIEVIGENGSVELEAGNAIQCYGHSPLRIDISGAEPGQALRAELSHFVSCIREGRKPDVVTLGDATAGLAIADAVIAALNSGGMVKT